MNDHINKHSLSLLFLISSPKLAKKAQSILNEGAVSMKYRFHAEGTASTEFVDVCIGRTDKVVTLCILPKKFADKLVKIMSKELRLNNPNTGIVFTMRINGINNPALKTLNDETRQKIQEKMEEEVKIMKSNLTHNLIMVIANRGFSEEIMDAAKTAGANGGTVINARGLDNGVLKFWGIDVQDEKEIFIIIANAENKVPIMKAISKECGVKSDANGVTISLPIDDVEGIV